MAMANGSGVRAVCGALMAAMGVALGISGAHADDLVGSKEIGASDAGDVASMATGGGRLLWSRQPGTHDFDQAFGVATDEFGNVYVVGETGGALGGPNKGDRDAWVIKYGRDGHRLWSRQPGKSSEDFAKGVATDTDRNVYVVGRTTGALRRIDPWVIKFAGDGRRLWSRQPGTSGQDEASGVATDREGNVYVVGTNFSGFGGADPLVIKLDGNGHRLWSRQPGTSTYDIAYGVATDTDGNVYVVGITGGALGGPNKGGRRPVADQVRR
jgi:hypothetical protein